ncbi:5-oxoprolinase subunit C family protein [Winogradskyella immobilis]|uniref:Biotin-dependent carboxyltransferase family protein n=1 Tax=Winogradskyella immobilis TaxID=2816852 RepID=A0ABS8EKB7_9FLAO|nr:biotin-dependent carboxyltransferase family protein [Winogradskyella immobilis]MCC1483669.1 biotin-dependent carboxyltransferase family protein [Winogradskyella immobilis]MCG0015763.1 biotin-dependent carboxyltransferase family protein [Winogradskyella immobilis]
MIEVVKPGFYSTIQDLGRIAYHDYGVPYSGAMDEQSAKIANALLGNNENNAVLEITMTGPTLKFIKTTAICITGADLSPKLNGNAVSLNKRYTIKPDDILSFGKLNYGFRAYLGVCGGFQTEKVMGSRSMYKNVTEQFITQKGELLPIKDLNTNAATSNASIKIDKTHFNTKSLPVYKGPEFDNLSKTQQKQLLNKTFTVSKDNNRMAYQLEDAIENNLKPIITSLVQPGTVQLPPSGKLIVLMSDGQTAGGYPRVLQLSDSARYSLAQKKTGDTFTFNMSE